MSIHLELKNISAGYGEDLVLRDFSLSVEKGELVALLGTSGCGKTTLLRVIAGLLTAYSGDLLLDGENITNVAAEKRQAAMVFQKPLLFPFLNVEQNVGFGLKMRNMPKSEIAQKAAEALRLVKLEGFSQRRVSQLSGGQEQRIALARALVTEPRVLLLDEPFSALDARLRVEMRNFVRQLQRRLKITTVFVTHDQEEAVALADRIAFVDDGILAQVAVPGDFFVQPSTPNVARFFGWKVFEATVCGDFAETSIGQIDLSGSNISLTEGGSILIGFHPARAQIIQTESSNAEKRYLSGKLEQKINLGARLRITLTLSNDEPFEMEITDLQTMDSLAAVECGSQLKFIVPPQFLIIF